MITKLISVLATLGLTFAVSASAREMNSIGVAMSSLGTPFFIALTKGITDRAKAVNPDVKVTVVQAEYDIARQFSQIDSLIAAKVDVIFLNSADPDAVLPAVRRAQAAGIPVIAVDTTAAGANATVTTDNVKAGAMACQLLSDKLGGRGKVIILNGPPLSSLRDRTNGCKEVLAKGRFEILSDNQDGKTTREGGLAVGQALMARFPRIDGIFVVDGQATLGAELAAKQLRRSEFVITGVDVNPDTEAALKTQTSLLQGAVAQNPYGMGANAVDIRKEILATGTNPVNPTILLEPILVTRDNISKFKGLDAQ